MKNLFYLHLDTFGTMLTVLDEILQSQILPQTKENMEKLQLVSLT